MAELFYFNRFYITAEKCVKANWVAQLEVQHLVWHTVDLGSILSKTVH
jgi:hypothetical protein